MGGLARDAARREARLIGHRWEPGRVAVGIVRSLHEDHPGHPKRRPLILIGPVDHDPGVWRCAALTSQPATRGGIPRDPVDGWAAIPLAGPAFYWSPRFAYVPSEDLLKPVGWVTRADVDAIDAMSVITAAERAALHQAATMHRGTT